MNDTAFDQELDCKGMNCPLPILKTKKTSGFDGVRSGFKNGSHRPRFNQ